MLKDMLNQTMNLLCFPQMKIEHRSMKSFPWKMVLVNNQMLHNAAFPKDADDDNHNLLLNTIDEWNYSHDLNQVSCSVEDIFLLIERFNLRIGCDVELAVFSCNAIII